MKRTKKVTYDYELTIVVEAGKAPGYGPKSASLDEVAKAVADAIDSASSDEVKGFKITYASEVD